MTYRPIALAIVAVFACANAAATTVPPAAEAPAQAVPVATSVDPPESAEAPSASTAPPAPPAPPASPAPTDASESPASVTESAADTAAVARARELFGKLETGEHAFDPAIADLYCDDAMVRNTRTLPDGKEQVIEIPAPIYKKLVRTAMPTASQRGDRSEYEDVTAVATADGVRVTATRYSTLKDYYSPYSLLIGDCAGGGYGIREEISRSQP